MRQAIVGGYALLFLAMLCGGQEDVADIPAEDIKIGGEAKKRYFRIGPKARYEKKGPKGGYGLLIIMPGGPGTANFHAFCKRIYKHACPDDYVAAQPVAFKWTEGQTSVWPTEKRKVPGQKFSTEQFVEEVVADVSKWKPIDRKRIFVLAWSSSGPAAYAISLQKKKSPTGFFISQSVFYRAWLPSLKEARGEAYFIDHSPTDAKCKFELAQEAAKLLKKKGAKTKLVTYKGGHGWHGDMYGRMREGLGWLEKNHAKPHKSKKKG
ncbi:MAG: hypothetical protein O7C98_07955 [Planctomycetota bacterium]|nr:hypothetical protein [Planctomycetota bacterium]